MLAGAGIMESYSKHIKMPLKNTGDCIIKGAVHISDEPSESNHEKKPPDRKAFLKQKGDAIASDITSEDYSSSKIPSIILKTKT